MFHQFKHSDPEDPATLHFLKLRAGFVQSLQKKEKELLKQFIHRPVVFATFDHNRRSRKSSKNTAGACRIRCGVRMAAARASIKLHSR
jgi:hypothetical protein